MIRKLILGIAATAAFGIAAPAAAQTVTAPAAKPAESLPAPDPARLAVARQIVLKMFPPGSYREMLGENFDAMMGSMVDSMGAMPFAQIAQIGGLTEEQVQGLGDAKIGEVMEILDPSWRERLKLLTNDYFGSMVDLLEKLEPRVREAMARSYARQFTIEQLNDIARFLETPTGTLFAKKSLSVFMDREVTEEMAAMMPEIMKEMPAVLEAQRAKIEALPPRRNIDELSDDERKRLADLLGVDVADLNDPELAPLP